MEIINKKAELYAQKFSSKEDKLLAEIASYTNINHSHAQMLSGHVQGKILETLSCLLQPKRILEIGTFTGYSALCLTKGLQTNGYLHTIELRDADADVAQQYFKKSFYNDKIILHRGDALDIIKRIDEEWDIVFIDADKVSYIDYYKLTLPKLKSNGLIIADNALFHGEVLEDIVNGKNAKAIDAFNKYVAADESVEQVMLTVRDGLTLIRKLV